MSNGTKTTLRPVKTPSKKQLSGLFQRRLTDGEIMQQRSATNDERIYWLLTGVLMEREEQRIYGNAKR